MRVDSRISSFLYDWFSLISIILLFCLTIYQGVTHFVSAQIHDNDDLKGVVETICENPYIHSAELYAVTDLMNQPQSPSPQPQPQSPSPQPPSPQTLSNNNLDLNDPIPSYSNLQTQDPYDIYSSYTNLLSQNDQFSHLEQNYHASQEPQTQNYHAPQLPQTSNPKPNEPPHIHEDPIIRFHQENMDDFSENEDDEMFHNNDQGNDEEGLAEPTSPRLQYHEPKHPVHLHLDQMPHYIDHHHFVNQQDYVQPPTVVLEVGMAFDEKAQCIRAVKEYNIRNHFDCYNTLF